MKPGQEIMFQGIGKLSENNKRFSLKKFLDNWFVLILICLAFYTAKVGAEQLALYAKFKAIENQRER